MFPFSLMLLMFNFRFNFCSAFSIFNTLFIHSVILNSTLKRYHNINLKKSVCVSDMVVQWNNACLVSKRSRVRVSECAPNILLDIIWYTSTDFNTSDWIRSRRVVVPCRHAWQKLGGCRSFSFQKNLKIYFTYNILNTMSY